MIVGALLIVVGGIVLVARARPARAREVDRARLRARRGGRLRGARQPRPPALARHRRRAGARGRGDARRRRAVPSPSGCSSPARRLPPSGLRALRSRRAPLRPLVRLPVRGVLPRPRVGRLAARRDRVAVGRRLSALLLRRRELVGPRLVAGAVARRRAAAC